MVITEEDYLAHYGILRKSGRYPWGSGDTQSVRNRSYLDTIAELKSQGLSETEIARGFGMTTTQLRAAKTIARNEQIQSNINQAQRLKNKGMSNIAIGEKMGINESSVRLLLNPGQKLKADILLTTSNMLKEQVIKKEFIDVGKGVEHHIGVTRTKLDAALAVLKEQGYEVHNVKLSQLATGLKTEAKILTLPGNTQKDVWKNQDKIQQISEFSDNGGKSFVALRPPTNVSAKRINVVYGKDGGAQKDGVIEIRPGAKDLDLGSARYAQVRIAVNETHYLKGMAVYNSDLPVGVDIRFNTNKKDTGNKLDAMKPMEKDVDGSINLTNPFGASIKPGGQRGALNIIYEEGDWDTWSRNLSSQVLSKQSPELAKTQLNVTYERRQKELDDILSLTNPTVRKKLLESFADDTDSASVHLKAAAIPKQATKVILPVNSVKPTEIYAPSFRDGERVALVRFPHGGTFEIPELVVNNRNLTAKKILGTNAIDAVGINSKVAERLSGADFDGDNVLVIPNSQGKIKSTPALEGLKGFDPRASYPSYPGMKVLEGSHMQQEMGKITNLITDMTIRGAGPSDKARAVRHSMVVIDAEKHELDYKSSARDNGIAQLKAKYQGSSNAGASTLISRASAKTYPLERKPRSAAKGGSIDKATGKKVFEYTGATYTNKKGKVVEKRGRSKRLAETDDAHKLSSGTPIERIYADHSNKLKDLANTARKEMVVTRSIPYSPSAKTVYFKEVEQLNHALMNAERNAPLERQAQLIAKVVVDQKRQANPNMDDADLKKIKNQALVEARTRTGASKQRIDLTQEQWNAIQAGAISPSMLTKILNNSELTTVRQLATPKARLLMTSTKQARATAMLNSGYTQAEVADALGVSLSTLKANLS